MHDFLKQIGGGLIGVASLFCWIPMVWLAVKIIGWLNAEAERQREKNEAVLKEIASNEPWLIKPGYWSIARSLPPTSDQPEAVGDFYVEQHECVICGVPAAVAPDLIRHHGTACGSCYFIKQPTTPAEIDQAVAAVQESCVCAVRYRGSDPAILCRISPMSVDNPFKHRSRR